MNLKITKHARERMMQYDISRNLVHKGFEDPDSVVPGDLGREIAQKRLNGHILRIIFQKEKDKNVIITVYKARSERYEI